jgi:hypothetical protein
LVGRGSGARRGLGRIDSDHWKFVFIASDTTPTVRRLLAT